MKTKLKIICDTAFLSDRGKLNIIGVFDKITASKFPATNPQMSVVFVVDFGKETDFEYSFNIENPNGDIITNPEGKTNKAKTGRNGSINIIGNFIGVRLEKAGKYTINLTGGYEDSISFEVTPPTQGTA